jgi:hypothetical protein
VRYLAPLAIAATLTATYFVVHASLSNKHPATHSHVGGKATKRRGRLARARFYVVQQGDTLSGISSRSGVPVPTLQTLNPNLNPNALQTGQRLRLRR